MHKAINAKFKKGDKVVSAGGNRGVVTEVYGNGEYAVHFDGDRNDTRIGEYQLRAANCAVANAKFKKGDKVVWVAQGKCGIVKDNYADGEYAVRFDGDRTDTWIAEEKLRAANCSTANSVVAKAVANARAANADDISKYRPGQTIMYKYKGVAGVDKALIESIIGRVFQIKHTFLGRPERMPVCFDDIDVLKVLNSSAEPTVAKNKFGIWGSREAEMAEIHDITSFEDREFSKLESDFLSVVDRIEGKWTACKERMLKKATSSSGVAKSDLMRIASVCEEGRDRMIRARKLSGKLFG